MVTEEVFSSITHGLGILAGAFGLVYGAFSLHAPTVFMISFYVYAASIVLLMLCSTLYHALSFTRANYVFEVFDHSSIYLLVAGSFSPFIMGLFTSRMAVFLLVLVWSVATLGIVVKIVLPRQAVRIGVLPFLLFGWIGVIFVPRLVALDVPAFWLLALGGGLYSAGVILLVSKKRFAHVAWHLFVIAAAGVHYVAVIRLASALFYK